MQIFRKHRYLIGIVINSVFVIAELFYGFEANSVALLADAVHNVSDVIGLAAVGFSTFIAKRQATYKFTWGFKNATIIAAFLNSLILILAVGNLVWESTMRLFTPEPVLPMIVIWVAAIGVLVNGVTAILFSRDRKKDLSVLSVFLSFSLDVFLSIAVVIGGVFIYWKNWYLLDPLLGLIIGITIIFSVWKLFKESLDLIFQAVPATVDLRTIVADLKKMPEIIDFHDLHVWALSTTETALSIHIVTIEENFSPKIVERLYTIFREKYNIQHPTIQLEIVNAPPCPNC